MRVAVFGSFLGGYHVLRELSAGEFVARSHRVPIPMGINAIGMHRITWPQMGPFIQRDVGAMLAAAESMPANAPLVLRDAVVLYRIAGHSECPHRLAA